MDRPTHTRNVAIYGGSFNPIHIGHVSLAQSLLDQGLADEVWLMVSPQNPLKAHDAESPAYNPDEYTHRLRMARLACRDIKGINVSDFESRLPIPSYTHTTLTELIRQYPDCRFTLVIGADNWQRFDRWYRSDDIIRLCHIYVYRRPGYDPVTIPENYAQRVRIVETPLYDVSSTEIRNHTKLDMIPPSVLQYIRRHRLYGFAVGR